MTMSVSLALPACLPITLTTYSFHLARLAAQGNHAPGEIRLFQDVFSFEEHLLIVDMHYASRIGKIYYRAKGVPNLYHAKKPQTKSQRWIIIGLNLGHNQLASGHASSYGIPRIRGCLLSMTLLYGSLLIT
jgi:hypothetical protein